jgi:hypothetical protein
MKKLFLILAIGLIVLIMLVVLGVGFYCGPIVKIGIEDIGPKVTQVSIKVNSVDVSLLTGSAQVKGLMVGNPTGYTAPQAFNVGTITVNMDTLSAMSNKILIHSVKVESPEITFEAGLGGTNLSKIMANVNAVAKNGVPQDNNKPAPNIEVDDLLITGAKVHVILRGLVGKEIPLPDIHLTDLGKGSNGLTPADLTRAVLDAILKDTVSAVASSANILGQSVEGLGKTATQTVGGGVSSITNSISGLFGK